MATMASLSPEKTLKNPSAVERWFQISARGSSIGQELRGGMVTFFTMAYILALNPVVIGTAADSRGNLVSGAPKYTDAAAGIVDQAAVNHSMAMVAAATALVAGVSTLLMGVIGRFPIGLATGLGLNAMCAYVIAPNSTWPRTMGMIVIEGIIITLLVLTGFREAVFRAVPRELRVAISVGIGLFITFVGLVDAHIVTPGSGTPVQLGLDGSLGTTPQLVFVIGLLILLFLYVRSTRGAMLIAIIATALIGVLVQAVARIPATLDDGTTNPAGWALNVPAWPGVSAFTAPDLGLLGRVDLVGAFAAADGRFTLASVLGAVMMIFSLLLADFFDTLGTVVAVGAEGGILDERGEPPHLRGILLADSLAALLGGLGSTSSSTSYIESTAGVAEGARTGVASIVTGVLFLLAIFLSPLTNMVPSEAVAPVLVVVGFLMMQQVGEIDWHHLVDAIPAFITIVLMPFSYSISVGIGAGFVVFIALKIFQGKARHVHPLMWVVGALFVVYFASDVINRAISGAA